MKLFSYVVARDYGFAPNPFFGVCTLATCKPRIRAAAEDGDWVVGTGSRKHNRQGRLVYAMRVAYRMSFDEYWTDEAYGRKRPNLCGSWKQAYGDNIYHRGGDGRWCQQDSHHSYADGTTNDKNVVRDTQTDSVLVSERYAYFGGQGPEIPESLRWYRGFDVCAQRGHKCRFPRPLILEFVEWFQSLEAQGVVGRPLDWKVGE